MANHCSLCNRFFGSQESLKQHVNNSARHKGPSQVQASTSIQGQPVNPSILGSSQPLYPQQLAAVDSIIWNSQATKDGNEDFFQDRNSRWSVISAFQQRAVLSALFKHCHSAESLLEKKYLLHPFTTEDLAGLRKCKICGILQKNSKNRASSECRYHPGKLRPANQFTPRQFSCCGGSTRSGCISLPAHDYGRLSSQVAAKYQSYAATPPASRQKPTFQAVTLDCEMAGVIGGMNEVILVCVADYFTGAILLNRYVCPVERVISWRAKIHGVTRSVMQDAISQGQALAGWKAARDELWKFIDSDTILVGHALQHDLDVLRMIHPRVVDSAILAADAVGTGGRQWGLKTLCDELLGIEFRENRAGVHDCLEDVLATREVVLWCTLNEQDLEGWADVKRQEQERKKEERLKAQQKRDEENAKKESRRKAKEQSSEAGGAYVDYDSENSEIMHWSDIAEACGWPHPDTGYDPWSD